MALFWFLTGMLTSLASLIVLLPWLRTLPRLGALPALPWQIPLGAVLIAGAAVFGLHRLLAQADSMAPGAPAGFEASVPASALKLPGAGSPGPASGMQGGAGAASAGAGSMESAIVSLEARLAKGGGSAEDWELLAKSFEFLGRPEDAAQARAQRLPAPPGAPAPQASAEPGAHGTAVSGEVSLAAALRAKAAAGATLFIVAKSVDSPGAPVAVYRGSVGAWPVKFTLDDSQSMLPGRNLSNAGRVTIEARISKSGQPLPAAGDLKGSTGPIDPSEHRPLKIVIDQQIP